MQQVPTRQYRWQRNSLKYSLMLALGFSREWWKGVDLTDDQLFELIRYVAFDFVLQTAIKYSTC